MSLSFKKSRILLSRLLAVLVLGIYLFSGSKWDSTYPIVGSILFTLGLILVAIGSLGRMWCSLYIAGYKDKELITQGPYSITRNPLYFFSFLGLLGVGMATETFTFTILFMLFFAIAYPSVINNEEQKLRKLFPKEYEKYSKVTPKFFPKISLLREPESYIVNPKIYRKHIFSALWFIWIAGILDLIEEFRDIGLIEKLYLLY